MLTTPAKRRGTMDKVPLCASTLSMIKIAMIDVNATVIYDNHISSVNDWTFLSIGRKKSNNSNNWKESSSQCKKTHWQAVPYETSIVRLEMIVWGTKSNCCHTNEETCPTAKLPLQTIFHRYIYRGNRINNHQKQTTSPWLKTKIMIP